jgi:hypothetical protein
MFVILSGAKDLLPMFAILSGAKDLLPMFVILSGAKDLLFARIQLRCVLRSSVES